MIDIGFYTKAILASAVAAAGAALTALQDGRVDGLEWVAIATAFVVGLTAVWAVPNVPASVARYGKAFTAAVVAGLGALGTALTDGAVTPAEWIVIAVAVVSGSGLVVIAPNASASDNLIEWPESDEPEDDTELEDYDPARLPVGPGEQSEHQGA